MAITLAEAEKAIQASRTKAEEMGLRMSIAVVDPRGDPVAALRMDGASYVTFAVARGKAFAAAIWGRPSGEMIEMADHPVFRSVVMMEGGQLILGQGGVPIKKGEEIVGAVGASGGSGQEDEDVSRVGADIVSSSR